MLATEGGAATERDNIVSIFGAKQAQQLLPIALTLRALGSDIDGAVDGDAADVPPSDQCVFFFPSRCLVPSW